MNNKTKEHPKWLYAALVVGELIAVVIITYFGYAIDTVRVEEGTSPIIRIFAAVNAINDGEIEISSDMFSDAVSHGSAMKKAFVLSMAAAIICFAYIRNGNGKRFHKKGIEHGSAQWGSQDEKNIIADTTPEGFYNNVIVAADVFLVLDRKQREINEQKAKERKTKEGNESKAGKAVKDNEDDSQ